MPRSQSDIANSAVRIFLQWMGAEYDEKRGFKHWDKNKHLPEVAEVFSNSCCYCGSSLIPNRTAEDHLIPMNKTSVGLHDWGNIVPSCQDCNGKKQGQEWKDFLISRAGTNTPERQQRLKEFVAQYRYTPDVDDLRNAAEELYAEVGNVATTLTETKIKRFKAKV